MWYELTWWSCCCHTFLYIKHIYIYIFMCFDLFVEFTFSLNSKRISSKEKARLSRRRRRRRRRIKEEYLWWIELSKEFLSKLKVKVMVLIFVKQPTDLHPKKKRSSQLIDSYIPLSFKITVIWSLWTVVFNIRIAQHSIWLLCNGMCVCIYITNNNIHHLKRLRGKVPK